MCAQLLVQRAPHGANLRPVRYNRRAWRRLLSSLATPSAPYMCLLLVHPLNARGHPVDFENSVVVEFHRLPDAPEWTRFAVSAPASLVPWRGSDTIQRRWTAFLADWAVRMDAAYGHVSDDADPTFGTALERVLSLFPEDTVPHSAETLRGYSWTTLCAPNVATRVGGPRALRACDAFHEVTELAGDRVLVRATHRLEQYTADTPSFSRSRRRGR